MGVGAKKIRELFKQAKGSAPAIIFIDEIDAIGTRDESKINESERNRTINELLTKMDGF